MQHYVASLKVLDVSITFWQGVAMSWRHYVDTFVIYHNEKAVILVYVRGIVVLLSVDQFNTYLPEFISRELGKQYYSPCQ